MFSRIEGIHAIDKRLKDMDIQPLGVLNNTTIQGNVTTVKNIVEKHKE